MRCQKCGSLVNDRAKFCQECGSEIVTETKELEGNVCCQCGNILKKNALFCNKCGHKLLESQTESERGNKCPHCNLILKDEVMKSIDATPKKKKDNGLVFLIVLLAVLIASGCAMGYIYLQNNSVDTEIPSGDVSADNKTENSGKAEYTDDNFDIEKEVLKIRELYNATQSNLSNLTKKDSVSGKVKYYDDSSKLVRMDIPSNSITSYTKYYYFENGELYFAFVFDGTKENRLYFKNNRLFRWIDEDGEIHDKERSNNTFIEWEKIVLNDLNGQAHGD